MLNGQCRNLSELGNGYSIDYSNGGKCVYCNTFKFTSTAGGTRYFGSYTEAVNYGSANDTCNGSASQYSTTCSKALTCADYVAYSTPNYTGRWYETGVTISESEKNNSDSRTCSLYGSYSTKPNPDQACSQKWYGTTYTSTSDRSSTCYANCRLISPVGDYDKKYVCDVNILYCTPKYYVTTYSAACVAGC